MDEVYCITCQKLCKNERSLKSHFWKAHTDNGKNHKPKIGIQFTDDQKLKISKALKGSIPWTRGKPGTFKGKTHSEETKRKLSLEMIKAHKEGRAHNIGSSRWNNEPSYPEKWFMKVIENEFEDKNYQYEKPFHRFSLDFVWEHKKKVIEIDGEQHERFEEQKRRDKEKDKLLLEEGYELLRLRWKDVFHHTKKNIKIAKEFIDPEGP